LQPSLVSSAACDESRGCLGIFREKSKASVILQGCLSDGIWHGEIPVGWFDRRLQYSKRKKTTNYSTIQFATIARLYCDNHNHRLSSHTEIQYRLLQNHAGTIFNNLIVPTPACESLDNFPPGKGSPPGGPQREAGLFRETNNNN
jgi:hypothetical protein